ncbi:hypothetical protein ASPWEDRAFT_34056 [Aspergillus wentii DTO 134E9]|uniref:GET complex, subunit GET2 n=1 Tax=Aspergillus wentii DTO 134E9 TaxID=1073089 RepID=A0A1L9S0C1_ASPWE|nr:uncharacterized protein ASPWEDRAFT_34056 [Aspergillus wentii DTO 134E9]KAI9931361.1 hypothetical protein MW887_011025 [Aspergillus wentii]OJJ40625.1 hypothetical protein ASPWEDRAFT_34056 [Aspergillus wentii DTO 134E9]
MSSAEESPAQKASRLRRERREAKIRDGGAARLDKITSLSGRTPAPREEVSPSPSPSPQPPASLPTLPDASLPPSRPTSAQATTPGADGQSPETIQAQQEFLRSLLRQNGPAPGQQGPEEEDPTMKLLSSLMGGAGAMPPMGDQAPGAGAGAGAGAGGAAGGAPALSPEMMSALGLPPFLSNIIGAVMTPQSEEEKKQAWTWKVLHVMFSLAVAFYLLLLIGSSVSTFGSQPPPPATARNPFLFFTTGEVMLSGARMAIKSRAGARAGLGTWIQLGKDVVRDGSLVLFVLGMGTWWHRGWMAY